MKRGRQDIVAFDNKNFRFEKGFRTYCIGTLEIPIS